MISIVIPVYNAERFIPAMLDRLRMQKRAGTAFEAVFVNDGSTDGSLSLLREAQKAEPFPVQVIDRENGGVSSARNAGIAAARGEYIAFADADDVLAPNYVEILSIYAGAQPDALRFAFVRVDADTSALREEGEEETSEKLTALFEAFSNEENKLSVRLEKLRDATVPAVLNVSEEARRMQEMMKMYAPDMPAMPLEATLVLNTSCSLVKKLEEDAFGERTEVVASYVYHLATLSQRPLTAEEMKAFLSESYRILDALS